MTNHRPKLAIVATHAIQHFAPVYRRLSQDYGVDLKVFYIAENGVKKYTDSGFSKDFSWDIPLLDGYEYEFLNPGKILEGFSFNEVDAKNINQRLNTYSPDFIWVHGYWSKLNWRVILGKRSHQRIIYSSDSNLLDQRSVLRKAFKSLIVKTFLSNCDHFLSIGEKNKEYLQYYGVNSSKIEDTRFPIDMQRFTKAKAEFSSHDRTKLRQRYGLNDKQFVVLFSGKLIDYKRPQDLVEALRLLKKQNEAKDVAILFMGEGALRSELELSIERAGLKDRAVVTGFINQSEVPLHLYSADVFALTSSKEPFGAVVSEALPLGLPIIASDKIGAVGENASAQPNKNAIVYPWGDIKQLSQAILTLYSDNDKYIKFRDHSLSLVEQNDAKVYCDAIVRCLDKT